MPHQNLKSFQNFDSPCDLCMTIKLEFEVLCITETWCLDNSISHNLYKLPNYQIIHQVRKTVKAGGIALLLHKSTIFHILSFSSDDIESICI